MVCVCMRTCMRACLCVCARVCVCLCVRACVWARAGVRARVRACLCLCTYIRACMCVRVNAPYMHRACMRACVRVRASKAACFVYEFYLRSPTAPSNTLKQTCQNISYSVPIKTTGGHQPPSPLHFPVLKVHYCTHLARAAACQSLSKLIRQMAAPLWLTTHR